jgi:polysaccharide export outer membrane protein
LFDALSAAGGLSQRAGRNVTITHRAQPDEAVLVKLSPTVGGDAGGNVEVLPGDTIVVAKAGVVYVVGDVGTPGGYIMDNNESVSVLQAVALAHGANRTAKLNDAKIIRRNPTGVQEIPIALGKILTAKAADLPLQDNDIVFVPNSAVKSAGRKGLESIIQVVTGIAIYHPY